MDLTSLTPNELRKEFLRRNDAYVHFINGKLPASIDLEQAMKIKDALHEILQELQRRRDENVP